MQGSPCSGQSLSKKCYWLCCHTEKPFLTLLAHRWLPGAGPWAAVASGRGPSCDLCPGGCDPSEAPGLTEQAIARGTSLARASQDLFPPVILMQELQLRAESSVPPHPIKRLIPMEWPLIPWARAAALPPSSPLESWWQRPSACSQAALLAAAPAMAVADFLIPSQATSAEPCPESSLLTLPHYLFVEFLGSPKHLLQPPSYSLCLQHNLPPAIWEY